MTLDQLRTQLMAEGFDPLAVGVEGDREFPLIDGVLLLRREGGFTVLGRFERGRFSSRGRFESESEALAEAGRLIRRAGAGSSPVASAEERARDQARAQKRAEELRRRRDGGHVDRG